MCEDSGAGRHFVGCETAHVAGTQGTGEALAGEGAPAGLCNISGWTGLCSRSTRDTLKTPKEGKSDAWVWFSALTRAAAWGGRHGSGRLV